MKNNLKNKINLWLNYSLVALAFVLPLSRSGISIFIGVSVVLWLAEGNWKDKWKVLKKDRLVISISLYIGWVLLSLLWTDNYPKAIDNMKNYGHFILVPIMLVSLIPKFRLYILRAYAMGIVILIVLSSLNYYKIFAIKPGNIGKPVVLMHHLDFSMFLAWTAVFGLALILFRKKEYVENLNMTWIDWGTWGSATLLSLGWIFVQTGRSGQLALVVGLIALIVLFVNNRVEGWVKKTGMVAAAIVLLAGTVKLQYEFSRNFKERIDIGVNDINLILKKNNYSSSLGIRVFAIKTGISIVKDYPITGVGIGDNMDVFKDYVARIKGKKPDKFFLNSIQKNHFHNQYIQILTETGLVGFVLFLSIIIFLFLKTEKIYSIMFILFFFSGFIAEPFLRNQFISVLFCFFMVIFSASREVDLKDQEIK